MDSLEFSCFEDQYKSRLALRWRLKGQFCSYFFSVGCLLLSWNKLCTPSDRSLREFDGEIRREVSNHFLTVLQYPHAQWVDCLHLNSRILPSSLSVSESSIISIMSSSGSLVLASNIFFKRWLWKSGACQTNTSPFSFRMPMVDGNVFRTAFGID